jgi:hypothetical protein
MVSQVDFSEKDRILIWDALMQYNKILPHLKPPAPSYIFSSINSALYKSSTYDPKYMNLNLQELAVIHDALTHVEAVISNKRPSLNIIDIAAFKSELSNLQSLSCRVHQGDGSHDAFIFLYALAITLWLIPVSLAICRVVIPCIFFYLS